MADSPRAIVGRSGAGGARSSPSVGDGPPGSGIVSNLGTGPDLGTGPGLDTGLGLDTGPGLGTGPDLGTGPGLGTRSGVGLGVGMGAAALGSAGVAALWLLALTCWRWTHGAWSGTFGADSGGVGEVAAALEILVLGLAGCVAAWLGMLLLLGALAALPGRSTAPVRALARRLAPRWAPRVAAGLVTAVVTLTPLGAAHASSASPTTHSVSAAHTVDAADVSGPSTQSDGLDQADSVLIPEPGWRPTTPAPTPDPDSIGLVSRGAAEPDTVVVRAGDTLWDIAARHLGPQADAAAIAEAWPQWHEANRDLIGPDPDFLLPGTSLTPPSGTGALEGVAP